MSPDQRSFMFGQVFSMSMMATAQRGRLYCEGASETERLELRAALRDRLERLVPRYICAISESEHIAVMDDLANGISSSNRSALRGGRLRIGSTQKVLNLYLKYMWCIGVVAMPPHCPFDSIVLARIPECDQVRWTRFDSTDEYRRIVCAAKGIAGDLPLAEWELRLYNDALARPAHAPDRRQSALPTIGVG